MEKESLNGRMDLNMKETLRMILLMVRGSLLRLMDGSSLGYGS